MKHIFIAISALAFLGACGGNGGGDNDPTASSQGKGKNHAHQGTAWQVASETCNGKAQTVSGKERLQLDNDAFTRTSPLSDDGSKSCRQALSYTRTVQSSATTNGVYTETSTLAAQQKRIICKDKASGATISDDASPLSEGAATLALSVNGNQATADINGSAECPAGPLHLDLTKM